MSTKKIFIVDDSPTATNLMTLYLKKLGYDISGIAENAEVALQLVDKFKPDLVLMDIHLGEGMNGIEAADLIMSQYAIPVIYVTSYSDDKTLERAKLSMPFGFINKPYRENDLRVNIELALSRNTLTISQDINNSGVRDQSSDAIELMLLSEALDHLISGVIVIDKNLQVYFNNKSANNILKENFPIKIKNNSLSCATSIIKRNLLEQINKNSNIVFSIKYQGSEYHMLIFPMTNPVNYNMNLQSSSIMFIFDTARDSDRLEEVIRTIYKLSPTEAKVASMLVFTPYLTDISANLGITYHTARTHLKHIYQKTQTNRMSALIQKIITGPAGLLIHSVE
ncbi:MAG: response regulator [Gammaproteobacteria bacterium]|jgi:DNA-binding NarL/FixJ family response regulator